MLIGECVPGLALFSRDRNRVVLHQHIAFQNSPLIVRNRAGPKKAKKVHPGLATSALKVSSITMRGSRTVLTMAISNERLDSALYIRFSYADGQSAQKPDRQNALGVAEHGALHHESQAPSGLNRLLGRSARMRSFGIGRTVGDPRQLSRIRVEKVDAGMMD